MELPGLRGGSKHTFLTPVGIDVAGFETDRETFLGPYRTYANPIVVETGKCSGTEAHGDNGCGCLKMDVNLKPGESREFMVIMGIGHAEKYGKQAVKEFSTVAKARKALEELKKHWHSRIGSYEVSSPVKELNSMVNVWNAYNALITFAWSRAASLIYAGERDGLGYRDTVQDILGVLNAIPDEARQRLELMIMGQVQCGGAMSVVKPFEHRPGHEQTPDDREYRSDDCLWLFNTVPAYVKETGDISFYDKVLPYADKGEATVFDHLRRALEFNIERSGAHGLPCGLAADWNDCLVLGFRGESLFVAFQVRYGLRTYIEIAQMLKRPAEVEWAKKQLAKLDAALDKVAWDGKWFIRAIREDGSIIGTKKDPEGSIFLNSQSWAVIAGAGTKEQAIQSMDSVKEMLATQYGIALCNPPFEKTDIQVVRAVLFNHSMKENGGIFCHPQSWAIIAETMLGRGNRAYEYLRAYLPAAYNERAEIRQIEPYVHGQSTHGKYSRHHGATRLPWLSGTVAWTYHTMTQYILGIRPEYEGLLVDPCVPSDWKTFSVSRRFRGATYQITVKNNGVEKGVKSIRVDGKEVPANKPLPLAAAGKTVKVEVTMGR
jgi:cellobiose phosphorylase